MRRSRFRNLSPMLALSLLLWTWAVAAQAPSLDEARRLLREGQIDQALVVIEQRLADDDSDRHARFLKGVALAEKPDLDAAIETFEALARDYPQLPEPHNNLAVLYASKGEYARARDALLQAINTHPSYATAHENLGDIYAKMAGLAYTRALSLDTKNSIAKDKLALIDDLFAEPTAGASAMSVVSKPVSKPVVVASAAVTVPLKETVRAPVREAPVPTQRAATKPVPSPAPVAVRAEPSVDGVVDVVQSWARAWASQDVEAYLAHYLPQQSPDASMSRARWEQHRRVRLSKPGSVAVAVDNFQVQRKGSEQVVVTFVQDYRSDNYADRVRKRLTMTHTESGWKISNERTIAKL